MIPTVDALFLVSGISFLHPLVLRFLEEGADISAKRLELVLVREKHLDGAAFRSYLFEWDNNHTHWLLFILFGLK